MLQNIDLVLRLDHEDQKDFNLLVINCRKEAIPLSEFIPILTEMVKEKKEKISIDRDTELTLGGGNPGGKISGSPKKGRRRSLGSPRKEGNSPDTPISRFLSFSLGGSSVDSPGTPPKKRVSVPDMTRATIESLRKKISPRLGNNPNSLETENLPKPPLSPDNETKGDDGKKRTKTARTPRQRRGQVK